LEPILQHQIDIASLLAEDFVCFICDAVGPIVYPFTSISSAGEWSD
jgi:hypothetical protein